MRTALVLVGALAFIALAGCGGGNGAESSDAPSGARTVPATQYAEQADELCRQLSAEVLELRVQERLREILGTAASEGDKARQSADVFAEQQAVLSDFLQDFEALGLPSEHRDDAERLIDKSRSAETELEEAIDAMRDGDTDRATESLQRYGALSQESASIARDSELDFAICGSGAPP